MTIQESINLERQISDPSISEETATQLLVKYGISPIKAQFRVLMSRGKILGDDLATQRCELSLPENIFMELSWFSFSPMKGWNKGRKKSSSMSIRQQSVDHAELALAA